MLAKAVSEQEAGVAMAAPTEPFVQSSPSERLDELAAILNNSSSDMPLKVKNTFIDFDSMDMDAFAEQMNSDGVLRDCFRAISAPNPSFSRHLSPQTPPLMHLSGVQEQEEIESNAGSTGAQNVDFVGCHPSLPAAASSSDFFGDMGLAGAPHEQFGEESEEPEMEPLKHVQQQGMANDVSPTKEKPPPYDPTAMPQLGSMPPPFPGMGVPPGAPPFPGQPMMPPGNMMGQLPPSPGMVGMSNMAAVAAATAASAAGPMGYPPVPPPEWATVETVMMRNLPNKYNQHMLLDEVNHTGFLGTFDFLYLPIDTETCANRGYAFINFIDPSYAWLFKVTFEGRKMNHSNSSKVVSVTPATLQGFEANYAHYSVARVNRGDQALRPLFLRAPALQLNPGPRRPRARRTAGSAIDAAAAVQARQRGGNQRHDAGRDKGGVPWRFCPACGNKLRPQFQFCPSCGIDMKDALQD